MDDELRDSEVLLCSYDAREGLVMVAASSFGPLLIFILERTHAPMFGPEYVYTELQQK